MRRNLRIANALFWIAIWIGVMIVTESVGAWVSMIALALIPGMLGMFIHIALRNPEPDAG